jgi:hypothetical protein
MSRRLAILVTVALALVTTLTLGACSAAEPAGDSSSFGEVSGSAVPVADELAALCEQVVAEALPLDAAVALAEASGYTTRVGTLDGQPQAVTTDFREDRMTFDVDADVVVGCTVG